MCCRQALDYPRRGFCGAGNCPLPGRSEGAQREGLLPDYRAWRVRANPRNAGPRRRRNGADKLGVVGGGPLLEAVRALREISDVDLPVHPLAGPDRGLRQGSRGRPVGQRLDGQRGARPSVGGRARGQHGHRHGARRHSQAGPGCGDDLPPARPAALSPGRRNAFPAARCPAPRSPARNRDSVRAGTVVTCSSSRNEFSS